MFPESVEGVTHGRYDGVNPALRRDHDPKHTIGSKVTPITIISQDLLGPAWPVREQCSPGPDPMPALAEHTWASSRLEISINADACS